MTRKPDRFEQLVEKITFDTMSTRVEPDDAVKLLRAEHRRVVRAVKDLKAAVANDPCDWTRGYECACVDILAVLTRVKGGRG